MIGDAVEFIRKELRDDLGVDDDEVIINSARRLVDNDNQPGAYISLVNVEEETALRNLPHVERRTSEASYVQPPVHVNLYLLFAFEFMTYESSLLHLSKTIEFFQNRRVFSSETQTGPAANAFPTTLEKLTFEMVNMNFDELNNLWGVLGGAYFPSVVYKARLVRIQRVVETEAPVVTTIDIEASRL